MSAASLEPLISELQRQLGDGNLAGAIDRLMNYLHGNAPKLYGEVLQQSGRFHTLQRQHLAGEITADLFNVRENLIRKWLIDFIERLPTKIDRQLLPIAADAAPIGKPKLVESAVAREKILGINNLKQISWLARGLEVCKSVCRVLTPQGLGTGFVVGPGLVMTNNHVIDTRKVAANSVIEFDYQQDLSANLLPAIRYNVDPTRFHTSKTLDYTLVGVSPDANKPPFEAWGCLHPNPHADPVPTEHVSIIQHPNGGLKQIVLTANQVVATQPPLLHYTTDTMSGSSGSPVFNDSWHVVAIHHASVTIEDDDEQRPVNEGILMSAIKIDAGAYWPDGRV